MPAVWLNGTKLHYAEVGEGDPVVLVHGGFADYRLWGSLTGALSKRFKVISYSRRGYHPNPVGQEAASNASAHSADLSALISRLSKTPVHLVAESYGAYVAMLCALGNPSQVRSIVVDEPTILSLLRSNADDQVELDRFENEVLRVAVKQYDRGLPESGARTIIDYLEGSSTYDSLPAEVKRAIGENSTATFADLKGGLESVAGPELKGMRCPTLLLKSELGPSVLKRVVDRMSELVDGSQMKVIKGTSHGSIVDSPVYCDTVLDFLSRF